LERISFRCQIELFILVPLTVMDKRLPVEGEVLEVFKNKHIIKC
jgi:hypothetical protein